MLAAQAQVGVDQLEGEEKKMINMCPKYVCLGKPLVVNFLSASEKKKLHIGQVCTVSFLSPDAFFSMEFLITTFKFHFLT